MPVVCPFCSREFPGSKLNARHLAKCNPAPPPPPCLCGHEATSLTQMKRHRRTCETWQSRDKKEIASQRRKATSLSRHGVEDASQTPEVRARRVGTNKARYGAENPFCREASTFSKVQEALEGKRPVLKGEDSPFAKPEVQEKIRATMLERYGAESPQQAAEIRARTKATNIERYGGEMMGSPELRAKAEETNLERYGVAFVGGTPEVQAKVIETNMARYGVPHTCMDPEVRRRQLETMEAKYGGHFFASEEGKATVRAALMDRYGVEFPGAIEGHWEKVVAMFRERYGVDHPLQLPEFLDKRVVTSQQIYGTDSPIQNSEVKGRMVATKIERYGNPWGPSPIDGPNKLETRVLDLAPPASVLFTGDFTWWRWLPLLGHHKNPDFIVPGPDPKHPRRGVTKVVEAFGDFWHSRMFTGKAPFAHEQELIEAFAEIGIECLVVWESEVKGDPEGVRERLAAFLPQA